MPATTVSKRAACCQPSKKKPADWLSAPEALELVGLYKMLANETRLRLLHALVLHGELCVGSLASILELTPQAVSNQLQRLVDRAIVRSRRQGNLVYYQIVNNCVTDLLDRGICLVRKQCP
jgi:DNA-binding transcriptional ArsR family regulator